MESDSKNSQFNALGKAKTGQKQKLDQKLRTVGLTGKLT